MTIDRLTLGRFSLCGLRDGFFSLDGGAMFGIVPKTLWERIYPADELNRIRLGLNSLLIQTGDFNCIVDTGIGPDFDPKLSGLYSVDNDPGLLGALGVVGLNPEDIDVVINTHLHFDHCGGNTVSGENGGYITAFPRARYVIQKGEWENALRPLVRDSASYLERSFSPLEKEGKLQLVEGDTKICEGLEVVLAPGHTAHHQCVKVESEGQTVFFLGDLVPTSGHIRLPYVMSYDLYPVDTMKNKVRFYQEAMAEDWILAFNHDPEYFFGKISKEKKRYVFEPL